MLGFFGDPSTIFATLLALFGFLILLIMADQMDMRLDVELQQIDKDLCGFLTLPQLPDVTISDIGENSVGFLSSQAFALITVCPYRKVQVRPARWRRPARHACRRVPVGLGRHPQSQAADRDGRETPRGMHAQCLEQDEA